MGHMPGFRTILWNDKRTFVRLIGLNLVPEGLAWVFVMGYRDVKDFGTAKE